MSTATCLPSRIDLVNGQDHWSVRSDHLGTRTRVNVYHDPVQGRSREVWGRKGRDRCEGGEGKREGGEWERKKKERGEAQEIVGITCM